MNERAEDYRDWYGSINIALRAEINRAELIVLHDRLFPSAPRLERYSFPYGDPRMFPFAHYQRVDPHAEHGWVYEHIGGGVLRELRTFGMPLGQPLEIERLAGPFFERWQYVVFWKEQRGRFWTVVVDEDFVQSVTGQLWGWGWPMVGTVAETPRGHWFIPTPSAGLSGPTGRD